MSTGIWSAGKASMERKTRAEGCKGEGTGAACGRRSFRGLYRAVININCTLPCNHPESRRRVIDDQNRLRGAKPPVSSSFRPTWAASDGPLHALRRILAVVSFDEHGQAV